LLKPTETHSVHQHPHSSWVTVNPFCCWQIHVHLLRPHLIDAHS
jgi:hypothetical protein